MSRTFTRSDFPYSSFDEGMEDDFRQLGGHVEVDKMLVECWKQRAWRKDSQMRQQGRRERDRAVTTKMEQRAARRSLTVDQYLEYLDELTAQGGSETA